MKKMIYENGICYCPECKSCNVVKIQAHLVHKAFNLSTKKLVCFDDVKRGMSTSDVLSQYINSPCIGVLCYECSDCDWIYFGFLDKEAEE